MPKSAKNLLLLIESPAALFLQIAYLSCFFPLATDFFLIGKMQNEKENRCLMCRHLFSHCYMWYLSVLSPDFIKIHSMNINLSFAVRTGQLNILSPPVEKCGKDGR